MYTPTTSIDGHERQSHVEKLKLTAVDGTDEIVLRSINRIHRTRRKSSLGSKNNISEINLKKPSSFGKFDCIKISRKMVFWKKTFSHINRLTIN